MGMSIPAIHYMIAVLRTTTIEVAAYATYGTEELARNVRDAFEAPSKAVLIANHGLVAVGSTLKEAADAAQAVETLAGLYYRSLVVGRSNILTDEQMAFVMEKYERKPG